MTSEEIFLKAIEKGSPAERLAYLEGACAGNTASREQVQRLLDSHDQAGSFLNQPLFDASATLDHGPPSEKPGMHIGPYKLLQKLGEGGMGVVYMGEQKEPVERRVALKIIKPGMDTQQVIARFDAERQALALMDHPNIARVLDAGTTHSGRPYFVMELVKGVPITQYCDEHQLTPRERLELFLPVCQAVQHAHHKGIIHRDLKPTNVLVTLYDDKPVPKVIDFGVAKATGGRLTERTMFTGYGQIVGTLEYMSPEQARLNALDVDTRSDIYSLGVLLYELLTGTTPFDKQRLREAAFDEMLRMIREDEPPKPSTRLSTSEGRASIAANRGMEPNKLNGLVRGELDWIVMKALEKDRNRRYDTANGFAADVLRYLNDEPVQACPPSAGYRLRKFVRRHKGPVLAGTLVVLALIAGVVGTTIGLLRALAAERLSHERLAEISWQHARVADAKQVAIKERNYAAAEAANFKAVNDFLRDDILAPKHAALVQEIDREITLREILNRASEGIAGRFEKQPLVEAALRHILGSSYCGVGAYAAAEPHCAWAYETRRRVLGPDHPHTLESMYPYALATCATGNLAAEDIVTNLLAESIRLDPEGASALALKSLLARVYRSQGKTDSEKMLCLQCVAGIRRQPDARATSLAGALRDLGECLVRRQDFAEAEPVLREALQLWQRFDPACFDVLRTKHQFALALRGQKRHAEAERLLLDAYEGVSTHWAQKAPNLTRQFLPVFLDDLIQHYEETDRPEEAAAYRKKRAHADQPEEK